MVDDGPTEAIVPVPVQMGRIVRPENAPISRKTDSV